MLNLRRRAYIHIPSLVLELEEIKVILHKLLITQIHDRHQIPHNYLHKTVTKFDNIKSRHLAFSACSRHTKTLGRSCALYLSYILFMNMHTGHSPQLDIHLNTTQHLVHNFGVESYLEMVFCWHREFGQLPKCT